MAGVIASTDQSQGVWKAPAGVDAELAGVSGLAHKPNDVEVKEFTDLGINTIRTFADGRIVLWGARTMSADPEWRYVPVRRLALFLEESIDEGTQWAVFEPNGEPLWLALRASTNSFLHGLFQQGAFQGAKPEAAYFVKCGRDTTTIADIEKQRCNIVVGFAPLKPAEFNILRIERSVGASP